MELKGVIRDMKKGMALLVCDADFNQVKQFSWYNIIENLNEIQKAHRLFKEGNLPWKFVILCDKDKNVILSFCLSSIYREFREQKKVYKTRQYLGYLAHHEIKLGCFAVKDETSFSNLVLMLLQKIEVYNWERESLGKKKAKQNFKKVVQLLYEYACVHSEIPKDVELKATGVRHYQILEKEINPKNFVNAEWREKTQELKKTFEQKCHEVYMQSVRDALSRKKTEFENVEQHFYDSICAIQNQLIHQELEKLPKEIDEWESLEYRSEFKSNLDCYQVPAYWLWKSFAMSRDNYPKPHKGQDDIITEKEIYDERNQKFGARNFEIKYLMEACHIEFEDDLFENILDKCYHMEDNEEVLDKEVLKALVKRDVYRGYINLLRRDAFIKKYHEIMFETYNRYLNPAWKSKIWN